MTPNLPDWSSDPTLPSTANLTADNGAWRTLSRELLYNGAYAKVYSERVATPTRLEGIPWTVVRRKSAVAIAARTITGHWLLIRQERIAIRRTIWEFPAGQIEMEETDFPTLLRETVWRELREETGYTATPESTLTPLGVFFPSAGFTDEHSHLFLADALALHAEGAQPDEAESIVECRAYTTAELRQMVASGEIIDANTLAAFARLVALGWIA
jgi:ADP-ribose pyrophosphatase